MRILSGIQPSGALHLGNYFGMMRPAIELQEQGEAFYFIANYHSMTSLFDAAERRQNSLDVALDFLACGLDPAKATFWKTKRSHDSENSQRLTHQAVGRDLPAVHGCNARFSETKGLDSQP